MSIYEENYPDTEKESLMIVKTFKPNHINLQCKIEVYTDHKKFTYQHTKHNSQLMLWHQIYISQNCGVKTVI